MINGSELKNFLDEKVKKYNQPSFITSDPIQIPKQFSNKQNIEISAFLTATIAWGQRPTIIKNATRLMEIMDNNPFHFISTCSENDLTAFENFKHRTFNGIDCRYFIQSIKNIYTNHGGLQQVFETGFVKDQTIKSSLAYFREVFFENNGPKRIHKHVSNVLSGSAAKRLNMFLRWMVRNDNNGVDFGIWDKIPQHKLMLPLDVHTGNISRKLGMLERKQNDWKAVEEITNKLRMFDSSDPIKYDFALFGLGIFEKF